MIKHSIKDDIISVSISKSDFSYRIPVKKIGKSIDWKIGEKGTKGIKIKNVSSWTAQLFTKKITEDKYIKEFKKIVQEHAIDSKIDWDNTHLALNVQNNYNWLIASNEKAEIKMSEEEIIANLKKKYKID